MPGGIGRIRFPADGTSRWAGMADIMLLSPNGGHRVMLRYAGEPPHGDSYHHATVDGVPLPGFVWGARFAFSADSRHLACSWMAARFERRTIVIDLPARRYCVLPRALVDFAFRWPTLIGCGDAAGQDYAFDGCERWTPF